MRAFSATVRRFVRNVEGDGDIAGLLPTQVPPITLPFGHVVQSSGITPEIGAGESVLGGCVKQADVKQMN